MMNSLISYRDSFLYFYIWMAFKEVTDLVLPYITVTSGRLVNYRRHFSYLAVTERVFRQFYLEKPFLKQSLLCRRQLLLIYVTVDAIVLSLPSPA